MFECSRCHDVVQEMVEVQGITQHVAMAIAGSSVYGLQPGGSPTTSGATSEYDSSSKVTAHVAVHLCLYQGRNCSDLKLRARPLSLGSCED